mmetsp:Transcript_28579/g.44456  ORF Transcript_28579/g.44456 Transcript_28579/m.44456 type:complete len:886 (-) Transcript_28579:43-2700(-)
MDNQDLEKGRRLLSSLAKLLDDDEHSVSSDSGGQVPSTSIRTGSGSKNQGDGTSLLQIINQASASASLEQGKDSNISQGAVDPEGGSEIIGVVSSAVGGKAASEKGDNESLPGSRPTLLMTHVGNEEPHQAAPGAILVPQSKNLESQERKNVSNAHKSVGSALATVHEKIGNQEPTAAMTFRAAVPGAKLVSSPRHQEHRGSNKLNNIRYSMNLCDPAQDPCLKPTTANIERDNHETNKLNDFMVGRQSTPIQVGVSKGKVPREVQKIVNTSRFQAGVRRSTLIAQEQENESNADNLTSACVGSATSTTTALVARNNNEDLESHAIGAEHSLGHLYRDIPEYEVCSFTGEQLESNVNAAASRQHIDVIATIDTVTSGTSGNLLPVVEADGPEYLVLGGQNIVVERKWYQKRYIQAMCFIAIVAIILAILFVWSSRSGIGSIDSTSPSLFPSAMPSNTPSASIIPSFQPSISPSTYPSAPPSSIPTNNPTDLRSTLIQERLINDGVIEDGSVVYNADLAIGQAFSWIVHKDEYMMDPSDKRLIQRFVLALLYFGNNGANWRYVSDIWLSNTHECEWKRKDNVGIDVGVRYCKNGTVTGVDLYDCNVTGIMQSELSSLSGLEELVLGENKLSGTIPTELGSMAMLRKLNMEDNFIIGTIPSELGLLSRAEILSLRYNFLSGTLPSEFENLKNLFFLGLASNLLTGTIPVFLSYSSKLEYFFVGYNNFSGTLPSELGLLSSLTRFWFEYNSFTGTIPTTLGRLSVLEELQVHQNTFTGTLPSELGNLSSLDFFTTHSNRLSGTIPIELGNLNKLQVFHAAVNSHSGTIPTELGKLSNLIGLGLQMNDMTGEVRYDGPICALRAPIGKLISFGVDCTYEIACDCCTECT